MATEFDDSRDWAFFIRDGKTLTNGNGFANRWSEQVLAALRSGGALDNMEDGTTPPATDKFWLDKNSDPAVLKEWDSIGSAWVPMTFDRLFGRAVVTELTNVGGTANAITVDAPASFIDNRVYGLVPTATNTGAATIQVAGVGTYDIVYPNGDAISAGELAANLRTPLLFKNGRFEIVFGANAGSIKRSESDPSGYQFVSSDPDLSNDTDKLALRGDVDANLVLQYAADDTALKALDIGSRKAAFNLANEGWWLPTSDDISAQITAGDPRYQPTSGDATGASGGWFQAQSISTGKKYANQGARIERIADRVMIGGEAVKFNGLPDGGGGKGGFLWDYLTDESTLTHGWMEQQALLSVGGLYNVDGAVSLNTYLAGPGVALNVHLLHDRSGDVNAASGAWAFYIDARRDLEFGTTWGCELDVINALPSPHTAFGPWGGNGATALGRTTGMQISGGGGPEINGTTYPVDVALLIQKNSTGFYTGIAFGGLSLEPDTGTGRMHAIALAPKQAIDWWGDTVAKGILASVVSEVTSASVPQELIFQNGGLGLFCGGNFLFHVDAVADAATYINIHPTGSGGSPAIGAAGTASNISLSLRSKGAATSTYLQSDAMPTFSATGVASAVNRLDALAAAAGNAVQLRALGADTDIDLQLTPKGTGNVRMGAHTDLGSETVTGYITIKDAGGTVRKLAVVS